jgi:hypothetical protein
MAGATKMAEDYDEVVARQPGGRLTRQDIQRARYGARLDEKRHEFWQAVVKYVKIVGTFAAAAAAVAKLLEAFHISL